MNNLWQRAFGALAPEHKQCLDSFNKGSSLEATNPESLISVIKTKKEDCEKKQWRLFINKKGEQVPLRDVLGKICDWVTKFQKIGDAAVEYTPHAAVPWAVIKSLTQVCLFALCAPVDCVVQLFQHVGCGTDTRGLPDDYQRLSNVWEDV